MKVQISKSKFQIKPQAQNPKRFGIRILDLILHLRFRFWIWARTNTLRTGFGLVETVVGAAILLTLMLGLGEVGRLAFRLVDDSNLKLRATFLTEEGIEALRILRDTSWSTNIAPITLDTNYYLTFSGGTFSLGTAAAPAVDGLFNRQIRFSAVSRDSNDDMVESGGTLDPNTKRVTVGVSWVNRGRTASTTISTYLTNLFNN